MTLLSAFLDTRRARRAARELDRRRMELREDFAWRWRQVCEHVGLCRSVSVAAGQTVVVPRLVNVDIGDYLALIVKLLPGQKPEDFIAQVDRIAWALGVLRVRIIPRGMGWLRIELHTTDPLDVEVTACLAAGGGPSVATTLITIARDESGKLVAIRWTDAPHAVVQGATRSGKSVWCYAVLAQLAALDDVLIAGCDPSGLLLGRLYDDTRHRGWQSMGTRDVLAHRDVLQRLVDEMDRRLEGMPERADKITEFTSVRLLIVVVLEEFPGLLGFASTLATPRGEAKVRDQLLNLYGRLVTEGHKVGFRVLVVTQRADATILGGFQRGQLGLRMSFRVADREAIPMLHQDARNLATEHSHADPGIALLETPTTALARVRGPRLPGLSEESDYAWYWDEIATATARLHDEAA
ncbi:FtsK/SpoIIIE domain-containing protein [Pseudonocardia sp. ICBG1293]|uniref:FtsK/SpoIIIE domain-containing protein n=1 Tax=Pseudonocardia sp. ICBG1293 TaxID=2844382 RepID=UPI001CCA646E|nr:FtsK/SpoIIIE domain-containing protein [Pseudonocardia sp. ICBG1293]